MDNLTIAEIKALIDLLDYMGIGDKDLKSARRKLQEKLNEMLII